MKTRLFHHFLFRDTPEITEAIVSPSSSARLQCAAILCGHSRTENRLFCSDHWAKLPEFLQHRLVTFYRPGQILGGMPGEGLAPSPEFALAVIQSVNHLGIKEGYLTDKEAMARESRAVELVAQYHQRRGEFVAPCDGGECAS